MSRTLSRLSLLPFLLLTSLSFAQSSTATLSGTVEDENGAVIPAAAVTIHNRATSLERHATTNESGSFTIPLLPPGEYTVLIERDGFTRVQLTGIILNVGDQKAVSVQLKVGDIKSEVLVTTDADLIRTDSSVGTVITRDQVENIPLNGRSFQTLFELTPGVNIVPSGGSQASGQFSVNGQRTNANYVTVDGVSANTGIASGNTAGQSGAGTAVAYTAQGTTASLASLDSLQEFRIQTSSYAPEFGRTPGGQISLVTRAGNNKFHGTAFEYIRNEAFEANDWFANSRREKRPPLRQHQFGGVFGGPILFPKFGEGGDRLWSGKDRLFFFFSYEGLRLIQPKSNTVTVPSLFARQNAHALVRPFLNAMPIPNVTPTTPTAVAAQFSASWSDPSESDATALRVDYNISDKQTVFARYSDTPSFVETRTGALNTITGTNQINKSFTAGSTWLMSNSIANDLRVNWTVNDAPARFELDTFGSALPVTESVLASGGTFENTNFSSSVLNAGLFSFGPSGSNKQRQFNIVEGLTWTMRNHTMKFGADFRRINPELLPEGGLRAENIRFSNTLADLAQPRASFYSISFFDPRGVSVAFDNLSLYAQDTWKATPRLTLTYGLRWEFVPTPKTTRGENALTLANMNDPYGGNVQINPRDTPLYSNRYTNFAPRFGVSYLLSQKQGQELVVRGGLGIFYDLGYGIIATAFRQYPFVSSRQCPAGSGCPAGTSVPLPLPAEIRTPDLSGRPGQLITLDSELEQPLTYQWNAAAERSFGSHQTLSVSYVGAAGRKLIKGTSYAIRLPQWPALSPTIVVHNSNQGYSDYRALQVHFQRRMHRNFQASLAYTWASSKDTASSDALNSLPDQRSDFNLDYGYSDYDIRHVMTGAVSYQIPKISGGPWLWRKIANGWAVDSIFRIRTALPINPTAFVTLNDPAFPVIEQLAFRPNVIPGEPFWIDDPTAPGGRRLNNRTYTVTDNPMLTGLGCMKVVRDPGDPSTVPIGPAVGAFCTPAGNRQGNLPRGSIRGFGARQVDVSLWREFTLRETARLQLRWDVFNITNTPNFADPSGVLSSTASSIATFGKSTQMLGRQLGGLSVLYQIGGPRSMQFSAKVIF